MSTRITANHRKWGSNGLMPPNTGKTTQSERTLVPTMRDIAWAAGVYEGEGTCGLTGRARIPTLRVVQKDSWLCKRLYELFGGKLNTYTQTCGSVKNPKETRQYWRWDMYNSKALGFLQTVYVLLSPRRQEQIRVVLDAVRRTGEMPVSD